MALYAIAAAVFGRGVGIERLSAVTIAAILTIAGLHGLYDLWDKIVDPRPIELGLLGFSAASAIGIGYAVLASLLRFRREPNPLIKATWISARNDAIGTTAFAAATFAARAAPVRWPEYAIDVLSAGLAFQGATTIVLAAIADRTRRGKRTTAAAEGGAEPA